MARILVADTDKSIRDLVRLRLTAWGHDVVSFADGQSALHAWREEHFDLTLVDLDLPRVGASTSCARSVPPTPPSGRPSW